MDRRRVAYAGIALLAVVAVALSAAALGDVQRDRGGGQVGTGGEGDFELVGDTEDMEGGAPPALLVVLLAILLVTGLVGVVSNPYYSLRVFVQTVVAVAFVAAVGWVLLWLFDLTSRGRSRTAGERNGSAGSGLGGGEAGGIGAEVPDAVPGVAPESTLLAALLAALLLIGVAAAVVRRSRDRERRVPDAGDEESLAAMGRAAGAAADHIAADAAVDNGVYRAWKEMVGHLDLERPESRTPEEFRAAAVDAGMATGDVDALTDLFVEVRYGDSEPTSDRERRARETLRRIQRRYAEADG